MRVDLFDFELPAASIALRPARPRDEARLLAVDPKAGFADLKVSDLPDLLVPGDALVFNDARVIPARLDGHRRRVGAPEARVSATLHLRTAPDGWRAFVKGARKLQAGDAVVFSRGPATLDAVVTEKGDDGEVALRFAVAGPDLDLALLGVGHIPLPPYIASKRAEDDADRTDYQTIYAREPGAVAAPTAGLHFTDRLLEALDRRGVSRHFVTLHVGAGTFLPVKVEDTAKHAMHAETGVVPAEVADALNAARARGGRIVAVGTTSLRLLESATGADGKIRPFAGATRIFIEPGYRFRAVDALMTNFHLPRSTLFMLVAAFTGLDRMRAAYAHAIAGGYRFYSYGDASLLFPDR